MTTTTPPRPAAFPARAFAVLLFVLAATAQAAEPFQLRTPSGTVVDFSGKSQSPVTVLLFWATWCPCSALMPHLQSVTYQYGKDVQLYAISVAEDGDPAAYLAELGYDWRTLLLEGDAVASRYGVRGTPGLVAVDRSGATVFDLSRVQASTALRQRVDGAGSRPKAAAQLAPFWAAELRRSLEPAIRAAR